MAIKDKFLTKNGVRAAIILIVALTSVVYANSLKNSFIGDDCLILVENDFVKSWKNFPAIFSKAYLTSASDVKYYLGKRDIGSGELSYRPVVTISYFIDYSLWKLKPLGYHLTNLLLHIFNAVLLYLFAGSIVRSKKAALLASLLFALHPVNTEVVNNISSREDLLAFLFFISSFILFIKLNNYNGKNKIYCYTASIILFLLALFSKEMSITLPILLMLYDYYFVFQGKARKVFISFKSRYLGYILATLFYLWVWFSPMANVSEMLAKYPGDNFYTNVLTMSKVIATYIRWFFVPIDIPVIFRGLSLISHSFFTPEVLFSIALIIICLVIGIKIRRTSKEISFAIFWFFITLLPVSNIWPITNIMSSRYLYIPAVGLCFLISILLFKLARAKMFSVSTDVLQKVTRNTVIVLLIFYSTFTIIKNFTYRNNIVFWSEIVKNYPNNPFAHSALGASYVKNGLFYKAISEFETAISLNSDEAKVYNALGFCYYKEGMLDKAIGEFKKALKINPDLPEGYNYLGCSFVSKKLYNEAIDYFKQAIKIDSSFVPAYNNLGTAYARMEKWNEAKMVWKKALNIAPENKIARDKLNELKQLGY